MYKSKKRSFLLPIYVHASYLNFDVLELISDKQDSTFFMLLPYTIKAPTSKASERGVKKWKVKKRKIESEEDKEKKIWDRETFIVHVEVRRNLLPKYSSRISNDIYLDVSFNFRIQMT